MQATGEARSEVIRLVDIFRGKIIDVTDTTYTVELTGDSCKLDAFLTALSSITIHEVVRSGAIGISRGEKALTV